MLSSCCDSPVIARIEKRAEIEMSSGQVRRDTEIDNVASTLTKLLVAMPYRRTGLEGFTERSDHTERAWVVVVETKPLATV